ASVAAGRNVARATSVPIPIRCVSAAMAPSNVKHSSAGRRFGGAPPPQGVETEAPAGPRCSAARPTRTGTPGAVAKRGTGAGGLLVKGQGEGGGIGAGTGPAGSPSSAGTIVTSRRYSEPST